MPQKNYFPYGKQYKKVIRKGSEEPLPQQLRDDIANLKSRILEEKLTSLLICDGEQGTGKTTLAVQIAEEYEEREIVFSEQLAMGSVDFLEKFLICTQKGHKVIIYDEVGDFNKKSTLSMMNQALNRVFETFRQHQIFVIMCTPCFDTIDNGLFKQGVPQLLCHIIEKGKTSSRFAAYSKDQLFWLKFWYTKEVVKPLVYKKVSPCYTQTYSDIRPERRKELDAISLKGKINIIEETIKSMKDNKTRNKRRDKERNAKEDEE